MTLVVKGAFRETDGRLFSFPAVLDLQVGLDGGNTLTKVWARFADGTEGYFLMPSLVAPGSWNQLREMRAGTQREQRGEERDLVISYNGIEHFAGWLAFNQLREATTGLGDELRYSSEEAVLRCLAAVSAITEEYEEELEAHRTNYGYPAPTGEGDAVSFPIIHVSLVSSVPVKFYTGQNRKAIKARFNGTHKCEVNGKKRIFYVVYQQTIMEGGGLEILAAGMPDVDLAQVSDNVTIDGGGDTVDFVRLNETDVLYQQCGTIRSGCERVADLVSAAMEKEHRRSLTTRERHAILKGFVHARNWGKVEFLPAITIAAADGSFVPKEKLYNWVETARKQVARQVISKASTLWGAANGKVAPDVLRGHAFFIGGETYLIDDLVKEAIPQIIVPDLPELANAKANAAIAQALAEK